MPRFMLARDIPGKSQSPNGGVSPFTCPCSLSLIHIAAKRVTTSAFQLTFYFSAWLSRFPTAPPKTLLCPMSPAFVSLADFHPSLGYSSKQLTSSSTVSRLMPIFCISNRLAVCTAGSAAPVPSDSTVTW